MGVLFTRIFSTLFGKSEIRILILGLDNAGKTTLLNKLQLSTVTETVPTIGFNLETVTYNNLQLQVWDLGGQGTLRPYWRCYYPNTNAVIYVIDSADRDRIETAKKEMHIMLSENDLKNVPLLIFANKQDLPGAMPESEMSELLGLPMLKDRQWRMVRAVVKQGDGVREGLDWLVALLRDS
jgi:ADP-ribosylation factor-like protein 1